jgi:PAS domain S-box-containing protein
MEILIVDDIKENLYMLETLLQGYGHEVESAADGVEALEKAERQDFDMIISDILMPRMDGFQLCRTVKTNERLKKLAFVFYTSTYTELSDEEFALSLGAEKFIVKPTEPDVFMEIIAEVIKSHEAGSLQASMEPVEDEGIYLKGYSERLARKLEQKMFDLEKANKALRESEEQYRDLIDNANDAVIVFGKTGIMNFANPKFFEMTGYSLEETKKLHIRKLIHPDELDKCMGDFTKILAGEKFSRNYELRLLGKAGETIYIDNNVSTIEKEGRLVGILEIMRDITARKRAEEETERLQAQLVQAQKLEALGMLAGGIAHDFNNILTAILGYTGMVRDRVSDKGRMRTDLDQVLMAGERAKKLVQQIFAFSRQTKQECQPVQVHLIVNEALKLLRASIPMTIEIRQNISAKDTTILADPTKIHQVLMNLCTNAYYAMRESGGILEVQLETVEVDADFDKINLEMHEGVYLRLTVSDTGQGMDQVTQARIFEPYFSTKSKEEGTGLGLAMVHGIVTSLGGAISVQSNPGVGSTFLVYFPLAGRQTVQEPSALELLPQGTECILYVDDELTIAQLGQRILESLGYDAMSCSSSVEALEMFRVQPEKFDLVITDQTMPNMTGITLAQELMRIRSDIPVILLTGFDKSITPELLKQTGIREFLMKPVAKKELAVVIRKILDKKISAS